MPTSVTVNGAFKTQHQGRIVLVVDATVGGKHHQALFDIENLRRIGDPTQVLSFVANQMLVVDTVSTGITTIPADIPQFKGTLSI
jgi:MinD-like ATPase involved in chromosome partitioning or flagellar assembly